ncbi:hypothetical protein O181_065970 [Austropuccinia psidii MF-1]|uniref:Reverse transcriptase Ty1/copia-type domain-containing protein n=1 Tax=Austropuccinia psidii MF-1 TaxID=1389203 RepID=A0A9Q3I4M5_9BASI|nr:hypothetical protein [Austropuccinia psidii MF-1]
MDVKTAFLHGDLDEDLHIRVPEGYTSSLGGNDPCFVFLHVDDLVIGGKNLEAFRSKISLAFDMKDLGELRYVLGMKVERDREKCRLFLTQGLYIDNLLTTFGMQDCKSVSTPQVPGSRLLPRTDTNAPVATINYRRGIGLLNYLVTCTRPDLAYSASCLAQFLNDPSSKHEAAFKHVLRYLSGTRSWGITLGSCLFFYGLVGWKTSKQDVVSLSSTEAEYRSISNCCQDVCWLLELVSDFGLNVKARLLCDNQGAIALLKNPLYQHRTRHIKLCLHWCRQLLNEGNISVEYVATNLMVADVLTKSLTRILHKTHCTALFIL